MRVLPLAQDNFDATVASSACLVIEFSNSLEDFADRAAQVIGADGVAWGHVSMPTEARLAALFGIQTDCALIVFREQIVLYLQGGEHGPAQMTDLVRTICALDMAKIKAEIEAQRQAEIALRMRRACPTVHLMAGNRR